MCVYVCACLCLCVFVVSMCMGSGEDICIRMCVGLFLCLSLCVPLSVLLWLCVCTHHIDDKWIRMDWTVVINPYPTCGVRPQPQQSKCLQMYNTLNLFEAGRYLICSCFIGLHKLTFSPKHYDITDLFWVNSSIINGYGYITFNDVSETFDTWTKWERNLTSWGEVISGVGNDTGFICSHDWLAFYKHLLKAL